MSLRVDFVPLNAGHIKYVEVNEAQKAEQMAMIEGYGAYACQHPGLEAWRGNRCLGMAGLIPVYPGRFLMAWALLSRHAGPYMLPLTRMVRRMLDGQRVERIEMTVAAEFEEAQRWAAMLGFTRETPRALKARRADGGDEYIYARTS